MRGKRILFFPWSHGVGFGYLARSLTIADALRAVGADCRFAADTREGHVAKEGFPVVDPGDPYAVAIPDMGVRQGDYIPIGGLDTTFGMSKYYRPARITVEVQANLRLIEIVEPDLCVVDLSPTACIAARMARVPLLSVGDSDYFRAEPAAWMPWVDESLIRRPYPSCVPAFNEVLQSVGAAPIEDVSDLLWGDRTWIASTPWLEEGQPELNVRGPLDYVGPIEWTPRDRGADETLDDFGEQGRRLYVSMGHGGKFTAQQLETVVEGSLAAGWSCYVGVGFRPPAGWKDSVRAGVRTGGFTGMDAALTWSDAVINHGGYTTVLATLRMNRPSIVLPFMSEQEANAVNFVERKDAGFRLRSVELGAPPEYLRYRHRYRSVDTNPAVVPDDVSNALRELAGGSFDEGAARAGSDIRKVVRSRDLVGTIERMTKP